ncbi:unnamed protein product [Timema podura]|uniref:Uncharacterized protein n=1 Tax=Timema podura TaxID=61482 RepID=A0ABN7NH98_TIMPD|nr:unnamed protein product [Timema podura]
MNDAAKVQELATGERAVTNSIQNSKNDFIQLTAETRVSIMGLKKLEDGGERNMTFVVLAGVVVLHVSHSSLMSFDRMKPRSGEWVVMIDFL